MENDHHRAKSISAQGIALVGEEHRPMKVRHGVTSLSGVRTRSRAKEFWAHPKISHSYADAELMQNAYD